MACIRILFIVKKNEIYSHQWYCRKNSGLYNSTAFVADGLSCRGIHAKVAVVTDGHDIDREVHEFRPNIVILEALWCPSEKFEVLKKLHPCVKWMVHLHSNIPFLAGEGIAIKYLKEYVSHGVGIIVNCEKAQKALEIALCAEINFLPNVYGQEIKPPKVKHAGHHMDIACFGAIRPMKNQLSQAIAAIQFARDEDMRLRFHINSSRVEGGANVLKNLRSLFEGNKSAELVEHPWYDHAQFIHFLRAQIDIGMQVSLTETFNITSADYVAAGLPIVVSDQVPWVSSMSQSNPNDVESILAGLHKAWTWRPFIWWNQKLLRNYSESALNDWACWVRDR